MQKINFQNLPSTTTPINATNLNAIQTNVEDVFNGNVAADKMVITNGLYSQPTGNVSTPVGNGNLIIKKATIQEAPNNGVVLEYGNSSDWNGQLFIGDNAEQGVYYNGWNNGVRGNWKKLAFENMFDISRGAATFDNTYISSVERNHYEKTGKVVTFEFTATVTGTWNNTTPFASGLPRPDRDLRFMALNTVNNQPMRIGLTTSGVLANAYSQQVPASGNVIEGRVVYITND